MKKYFTWLMANFTWRFWMLLLILIMRFCF